jgi:putative tryptophan/tyrosine transport system substrate-binding protein
VRRRTFVAGLAGAALGTPFATRAQQRSARAQPLLLFLAQVAPVDAFVGVRKELSELGYEDGRNIVIQELIGGRSELSAELKRHKPDVIYAVSPTAIRAAWESPNAIPIVALDFETDPLRSGYVRSFAQPGGRLTGVFLDQPELGGKWLQLLREAAPSLSHVAVLWDVAIGTLQLEGVKLAAEKLGVQAEVFELRTDLDGVLGEIKRGDDTGLILLSSPVIQERGPELANFARAARLPSISMFPHFPRRGGLLSYGGSGEEMRTRVAKMIDKVLKGERPGNIPIERPAKFVLGINLKTAAALGLSIPLWMLQQADEVIE